MNHHLVMLPGHRSSRTGRVDRPGLHPWFPRAKIQKKHGFDQTLGFQETDILTWMSSRNWHLEILDFMQKPSELQSCERMQNSDVKHVKTAELQLCLRRSSFLASAAPCPGPVRGPVRWSVRCLASSAGRELLGTRWNPMDFCSPKVPLKNVGEVGVVHSKKGLGLWSIYLTSCFGQAWLGTTTVNRIKGKWGISLGYSGM